MLTNVYRYIRFLPKTGLYRSKVVSELVEAGISRMPRAFIGAADAEKSCVYGLVLSENANKDIVDELVSKRRFDIIEYIEEEEMERYRKEYEKLEIDTSDKIFSI